MYYLLSLYKSKNKTCNVLFMKNYKFMAGNETHLSYKICFPIRQGSKLKDV